jgi:hypothetical protein
VPWDSRVFRRGRTSSGMSMIVEVDMTDHTVSEKQIQRIRDNLEEIQENTENPSVKDTAMFTENILREIEKESEEDMK